MKLRNCRISSVRIELKLKNAAKAKSAENNDFVAACFDLQAVISLPKTNESQSYYRRKLSVYNETVYELNTKQGYCYTWYETVAKRGSNEVCTALKLWLQEKDEHEHAKHVSLFADGCPGQNKNSIIRPCCLISYETLNQSSMSISHFSSHTMDKAKVTPCTQQYCTNCHEACWKHLLTF